MIKLFDLLTSARKSRRVSVQEISEALDISRSSIYRYEKHEFKTYDVNQMCRIAIYLRVSLEDVLDALKDEYSKEYLNTVADVYKAEHIAKYGYYDDADGKRHKYKHVHTEALIAASNHAADTLDHVYKLYNESMITSEHIELIDYIARNLSQKEARKAIDLMRLVFNDENI